MNNHYIIKCDKCAAVMGCCCCPAYEKIVRYITCAVCVLKEELARK